MAIRLFITFLWTIIIVTSCNKSNEQLFDEALAYKAQGEFETSIKIYSKIIARDNTLQAAYYNRGLCFIALKDYKKAFSDFDKVVNMHHIGGFIFELNKDAVFGTDEMKASISYNDALYQRAQVKYLLDSLGSARSDFLTVYNANYKRCQCLLWLGLISISQGDSTKGCKYFNLAKEWAINRDELEETKRRLKTYCN